MDPIFTIERKLDENDERTKMFRKVCSYFSCVLCDTIVNVEGEPLKTEWQRESLDLSWRHFVIK
jgi:hypothetical protein